MLTIGRTPESLNTFAVALLDYLEALLTFQSLVLVSVNRNGMVSSLSNNCRLAAVTQCVQDSAALYDLSLKALIKLHALLPPESLASSRERFNRLFILLGQLFVRANTFSFFHDLLKIPLLPNSPPNFLDGVSATQSTDVAETPSEKLINPLVDLNTSESINTDNNSWKVDDIDTIFGVSTEPKPSNTFASPTNDNALEVEALRREIQRLQLEKFSAQDQLREHIRSMENEIKALIEVKSRQDEQLLHLINEVKAQTTATAAAEEKFVKFRDAYGKLRGEHVALLKQMQSGESGNGTKQLLTKLELEKVSWQDARHQLETQLAENRLALEAAESRSVSLAGQLEGARKDAEREARDLLLKAACLKAQQDANAIMALLDNSEFVQCRSCADVVNTFTEGATAEVKRLKNVLSDKEGGDSAKLPLNIAHFSSYLNASALHAKAIANSAADIIKSDELTTHCRRSLNYGLEIYSLLIDSTNLEDWRVTAVLTHIESVIAALSRIQTLAEELQPHINDVNEKDLASALENEMQYTAELIAQAETRFKELLEQSRTTMTGVQLEVHSKILGSCTELMSAIAVLIARARELQTEIVNEGRGATIKEFYKRHNRWTEGLFSAAKTVGAAANLLVESADTIVSSNDGHFERLMVAAMEISSSTTQLLVASRVKAAEGSERLSNLEIAAKNVSRVTGDVVTSVQNASSVVERSPENMELSKLSYTQAHKTEMDSQVRVLKLEAQLVAERKRLAEIRRYNYNNAAEFEQKSKEDSREYST
ncbi:hypothetical protein Aperf_G00000060980 [Anoplocephala perfoliata]